LTLGIAEVEPHNSVMIFALLSVYALVPWEIEVVFFEPYQEFVYYDEVSYASGTWRAESHYDFFEYGVRNFFTKLKFNGRLVYTDLNESKDDQGQGGQRDAGFIRTPEGRVFFVHREHSGMGHGEKTRFYSMYANGKIKKIHEEEIENNGPIFRDFDGDDQVEWVFDDYDYYTYYGDDPKWLLVYKPEQSGKLKLWKKIPNKHKIWLDRLQVPSWQKGALLPATGMQKFKFE